MRCGDKTQHTTMTAADKHCAENGHRLTDPRKAVLEILLRLKKPAGAYDIIAAMPKGTKPPTVYRALEFWEREGFVHVISSLNVYAVCHAGHRHEGSQFMVCDDCGTVEEAHLCHLPDALKTAVNKTGFKLARWNTELHGTCARCCA